MVVLVRAGRKLEEFARDDGNSSLAFALPVESSWAPITRPPGATVMCQEDPQEPSPNHHPAVRRLQAQRTVLAAFQYCTHVGVNLRGWTVGVG